MTPRPFVVSQRLLASALLRPGQLWSSLSPHRRYPGGPRKKALLIAINYSRAQNPNDRLSGLQQEMEKLKALLLKQYGYIESAIVVMSDEDGIDPQLSPTRENILREIERLYEDQEPGDQYLFYFAGHSCQKDTDDKKEEDGRNELIMPVESYPPDGPVDTEKAIVDDVLKELLVDRLDAKSRLTVGLLFLLLERGY
ncbi:putative caspase domain containing protein [Lyophyllum shimeji]|uniref:Caspase domain containing protein n=1 Tax=Lyophyllum shimeji TaxID=47721 RepID=A0A9P3USI3_LYOSH|nr:putative caspase domain containing protein [Lyophyllum shimeji]